MESPCIFTWPRDRLPCPQLLAPKGKPLAATLLPLAAKPPHIHKHPEDRLPHVQRTLEAKEHTPHLHIGAATERNPTLPSSRTIAQPLLPPVSHSTMCLVITPPAYHSQSLTYHWEAWGQVSQPSLNHHCWDLNTPPRSLRLALPELPLPPQLAPTCPCHCRPGYWSTQLITATITPSIDHLGDRILPHCYCHRPCCISRDLRVHLPT